MRALLQRVSHAEVTVNGKTVGACLPPVGGQGILVLLGISHADTASAAAALASKVWTLRLLDGERSAAETDAPILVISQFTLYADTSRGRRPSWSAAAQRSVAEPLVEAFCEALRTAGAHVQTGEFGAKMDVSLVNVGPMTVLLEA